MRILSLLPTLGTLFVASNVLASELYNLDFTPPEVGTYITVFGNPSIQPTVGPLNDALVFHAVTSYEQISLPIQVSGPRYEIQYDVLPHALLNSQYGFSVLLDTPEAASITFHGGLNRIDLYQPFVEVGLGAFANDQVYHIGMTLDLQAHLWTVSVNGTEQYNDVFNGSSLQSVRFSMSPVRVGAVDAPGIYAALDNVTVTVIPEPSVLSLLGLGFLVSAFVRGDMRSRIPRSGME